MNDTQKEQKWYLGVVLHYAALYHISQKNLNFKNFKNSEVTTSMQTQYRWNEDWIKMDYSFIDWFFVSNENIFVSNREISKQKNGFRNDFSSFLTENQF